MAQIVVDDLDPVVIEKLTAQAQQHGRSLSAELKAILLQALSPEIASATSSKMTAFRERSAQMRAALMGRVHTDSTALVREDRER